MNVHQNSMLILMMRAFFEQQAKQKTFWIGYSGGLDSHVLLSLCHQLQKDFSLHLEVIHINHGLSPYAKKWSDHCARICDAYGLNFHEQVLQCKVQAGESLEDVLRKERYAIFAKLMQTGDILLTAHQQDDQAETLLLQLLRGAGLKGLSAMPMIKPFAKGLHARPLLSTARSSLEDYAHSEKLTWIEDESNLDMTFTRNYIRHDILPRLKKRWPSVTKTISRSAAHCAEAQKLLENMVLSHTNQVSLKDQPTLSVGQLLTLPLEQQKIMLRTWILHRQFPLPNEKKLSTIQQNVLHAKWDSTPCVTWERVELRRYRDQLYLQNVFNLHDESQIFNWDVEQVLNIPSIGKLSVIKTVGKGFRADLKQVKIKFRCGGETIYLEKRGHRTLKNLFQWWGIPPWQRSRIPLVLAEDKIIGVHGYFIDAKYMAKENEIGFEIILT